MTVIHKSDSSRNCFAVEKNDRSQFEVSIRGRLDRMIVHKKDLDRLETLSISLILQYLPFL